MKNWILSLIVAWGLMIPAESVAAVTPSNQDYKRIADFTGVRWSYLVSYDQYEKAAKIPEWAGLFNPDPADRDPSTIPLFYGTGRDGNLDGIADPSNPIDRAYSRAFLMKGVTNSESFQNFLLAHYKNKQDVNRIIGMARVYETFQNTDLQQKMFPIPKRYNYTYKGTWGAKRGWGGRRTHQGIDIFAGYGTPVVSTCYGFVEVKGWNIYGGWRVGIRDTDNMYHYFAHLSGFEKGIREGAVVRPGQVIGYVGSSGYGKAGTSGKFPPHLHYGIYKITGKHEWAFDPYPLLRQWERQAKKR